MRRLTDVKAPSYTVDQQNCCSIAGRYIFADTVLHTVISMVGGQ